MLELSFVYTQHIKIKVYEKYILNRYVPKPSQGANFIRQNGFWGSSKGTKGDTVYIGKMKNR